MAGIYGSLLVGVSGLHGNSTRMGAISDNIANIGTVGYKRAESQFQTMVTSRIQATNYSPGGILPRPRQAVDVQGVISSSSVSTDIAISGKGMFVVTDTKRGGLDAPTLYTRAGSFRTDNQGYLRNAAGFYLRGYPTNGEGEVIDPRSGQLVPAPGRTNLYTVSMTNQQDTNINIERSVKATTKMSTEANIPGDFPTQALPLSVYDNSGNVVDSFLGNEAVTITNPVTLSTVGGGARVDIPVNLNVVITGAAPTISGNPAFPGGPALALALPAALQNQRYNSSAEFVTAFNALPPADRTPPGAVPNSVITAAVGAGGVVTYTQTGLFPVLDNIPAAAPPVPGVPGVPAGPGGVPPAVPAVPAIPAQIAVPAGGLNINITLPGGGNLVVAATAAELGAPGGGNVTPADFVTNFDLIPIARRTGPGGEEYRANAGGPLGDVEIASFGPRILNPAGAAAPVADITNAPPRNVNELVATIAALPNQNIGGRTFNPNAALNQGKLEISMQEVLSLARSPGRQIAGITGVAFPTPPQNVTIPANFVVTLNNGAASTVIDLSGNNRLTGRTMTAEALIAEIQALGPQTATGGIGGTYTLAAVPSTTNPGQVTITATQTSAVGIGAGLGSVIGQGGIAGSTSNAALTFANNGTLRAGTDTGPFAADSLGSKQMTQSIQVYDSLGSPHTVKYNWVRRSDEPNLWEVRINEQNVTGLNQTPGNTGSEFNGADPAAGGVRFAVALGNNTQAPIFTQRLFVKFNGDGALQEVRVTPNGLAGTTLEGRAITNGVAANRETDASKPPKIISVAIGPIIGGSFAAARADGAPFAPGNINQGTSAPFAFPPSADSTGRNESADPLTYEWNIGRPTSPLQGRGTGLDGLTQFDSGENPPKLETHSIAQNGARVGTLSGVEVREDGTVYGVYDNGLSRSIWKLPIATFTNPNKLINRSGNVYQESSESGAVQFRNAKIGGAGSVIGGATEKSNVDLGEEFTNMIITQQSFTANTRTVTTADKMLQELVRILQ